MTINRMKTTLILTKPLIVSFKLIADSIVNFKLVSKTLKGSEIKLAITTTLWINFYLKNKTKQKTLTTFVINRNEVCEAQNLLKLLRAAPNNTSDEKLLFLALLFFEHSVLRCEPLKTMCLLLKNLMRKRSKC